MALAPPSPNVQDHEDGLSAEESVKLTNNGAWPDSGEAEKAATGGNMLKVAAMVVFVFIVVTQAPAPAHPPPVQPPKVQFVFGTAFSVITVPGLYVAVHTGPQLIPAPVTVPEPISLIVREGRTGIVLLTSFE